MLIFLCISRSSAERRMLKKQSWTSTTVGSTVNPFTQSSPLSLTSGKLVVASTRWGESALACAGGKHTFLCVCVNNSYTQTESLSS